MPKLANVNGLFHIYGCDLMTLWSTAVHSA